MITLHGVKINVGDKVWDFHNGWDEVIGLDSGLIYKIETNSNCYTSDGQYCSDDLFPSLFWNEFKIPQEAFTKPLPDLVLDTEVLVWQDGDIIKEKRYFSHFDNTGTICCFFRGNTWRETKNSKTVSWDNWELYEEEK